MSEETVQPAEPANSPAQTPTLTDQYDLGDVAIAPGIDTTEPPRQEPAAPATPPRGADGRFQPTTPASRSPRLIRLATEFGLSDAEIADSSPEALETTVYHLSRQAMQMARDANRQDLLQGGADRRPAPAQPAPEPEPDDLGLDEAAYDPGLLGALKRQAKELKELKALMAQTVQRDQARENETVSQQIDRHFSKHESILGKGRGRELKAESPEHIRRMSVLAIVDRDRSAGSLEEKIDRAVEALFGSVSRQAAPDPLEERRQQWANGTVARPTQRTGSSEPKGERKATQTAAKIMKDRGLLDEDDFPEGSFPD